MKKPHIYYNEKDQKINCSCCGSSETMINDGGFEKFEFVDHEYNKNIVNPSSENPDIKFRIVCHNCERKTNASHGPVYCY